MTDENQPDRESDPGRRHPGGQSDAERSGQDENLPVGRQADDAAVQFPAEPGQPQGAPDQLDPTQLEQFRQFQQFQEFLRFTEAQRTGQAPAPPGQPPVAYQQQNQPNGGPAPPAMPPPAQPGPWPAHAGGPQAAQPPKTPLWRKVLRSKIFRRMVYLLLVLLALNWGYEHYFGSDESDNAQETGGRKLEGTVLIPKDPRGTIRNLYLFVADSDADTACGLFTRRARATFANNTGAKDCVRAVRQLSKQVTSTSGYTSFSFPAGVGQPSSADPKRVTISSCALDIQGGQPLGTFTLEEIDRGQWIITDHQPGPQPCPKDGGTS